MTKRQIKPEISRRALLSGAVLTAAATQITEAQTAKPAEGTADVVALEKLRGVPLTEAQRKFLPVQLKDVNDTGASLRAFTLKDGQDDLALVFHPYLKTS